MGESLNKAQEQQLRSLFDAIMQDNIVLRRSFGGDIPGSYVLTKSVNRIMEERPELRHTAICMILYPAMKWVLQATDIDALIEKCENVDESSINDKENLHRLELIRDWLAPNIDEKTLHFKRRARYFKICTKIVNVIEDASAELRFERDYSSGMQEVFECFLDPSKLPYNGRGKIMKYCERCIEAVYDSAGSIIEKYYENIMANDDIDGIEEACLYHNVPLLLSEYTRILHRSKRSSDPAMRMLATSSYEELRQFKASEHTMTDAYMIIQYVMLIRGAIEMMKTFPLGERYYDVIVAMVKGKEFNWADEQVAKSLGITAGTFSTRKGHAIGVFGSLLWGCDVNGLLNCLIDVRV